MVVGGVRGASVRDVPVRRGPEQRAFSVGVNRGGAAERALPSSGVTITSLLSMQEYESPEQQDQRARHHGEAITDALGELQRALLGDGAPELGRLTALVERPIYASDPLLAGIVRALRVRAGVELARRRCGFEVTAHSDP